VVVAHAREAARRQSSEVKALFRHPQFRQGVLDMASVAPGIAAWGLMTGVATVKSGLGMAAVLAMSVLVFAGSSQLAALPLFAAGAPMWVILATALCVNLRFIVFSVHLRPYVVHQRPARRLLNGYLFADMNYVLFIRRFPQPALDAAGMRAQDAYWSGSGATGWLSWVASGLAGVALASTVPPSWGLGFAGILALLGIMLSLATDRLRALSAAVAGAAAVAAFALPLKLDILVAIAAAVVAGLMLEKMRPLAPPIEAPPELDPP
jgi:predicted branched-subunit amino acid permease